MNFCAFELAIDDRSVDVDVGMMPLDQRDPFGRRDDADHADDAGAGALQQIERRHGAAAGRQHRIDHQHVARVEPRRQLRVVLRGDRRHLVALQADVADARARAPARAPRRASRARRAAPARPRRRRRSAGPAPGPSGVSTVTSRGRHVAQRFGGEQHADARRRAAEMFGRRVLVAQRHQRVVHERMIDDVDRHGLTIHRSDQG